MTEGIRRTLNPYGADRARLIAAIFALSPLSFFHLVFTPETPLLVFVFLSALALLRASQRSSPAWAFVSGLLLSAAILSKYNALWFGAVAFYLLVLRPGTRSLKLTLAFGLGCLPSFVVIGLYNYNHCWINWSRAASRMAGRDLFVMGPVAALLYIIYGLTPWSLWAYFHRNERKVDFERLRRLLPAFIGIPLACFFYVSLKNKVGIHWMQSFYPFFFLLLFESRDRLLRLCLKLNAALSGLQLLAILGVLALPLSWLGAKSPRYHHDVVIAFQPKDVCAALRAFAGPEAALATFDYSQSSTLWVGCGERVLRYGYGALDGRDFDKLIDYRALDSKPLAVLWQNPISTDKTAGALLNPRFGSFEVHGKTFHAVVGTFSYENYKQNVLEPQLRGIYDPSNRKLPNDACYFKRRYFPELLPPRN